MLDGSCPVEFTLSILDGKWTFLIMRDLLGGVRRFGELRNSLRPISPKTLTDRLRALEEQEIITRTIFSEVPLQVEYRLTERGKSMKPIFQAMITWAETVDPGLTKETCED